jgi:hypothetical protein
LKNPRRLNEDEWCVRFILAMGFLLGFDYGFRDIMQVQPSKAWDFNFIFSSRSFGKTSSTPQPNYWSGINFTPV